MCRQNVQHNERCKLKLVLSLGETDQHCLANTIVCFCVIGHGQSRHVTIRTSTVMFTCQGFTQCNFSCNYSFLANCLAAVLPDKLQVQVISNQQSIRFNLDVKFCRPFLPHNQILCECLHHFNLRSLDF